MQGDEIIPILGFAEPVSSFTHFLGAGVFAYLAVLLLRRINCSWRYATLSVFAFSGVFLLLISGIYHLLPSDGVAHSVFRRLDHAAIFMFIAGTFTPIHIILFEGFLRWGMIAIVWTIAATGVVLKAAFFTQIPEIAGFAMYMALGWLGLVAAIALWRRNGFAFVKPLVWGGIAYTIGALGEVLLQPVFIPGFVGPHEFFHLAVLAGISFHWMFVKQFCEPSTIVLKSRRDNE